MAFTNAERAGIRKYLGWNARWVQFDSALERAFSFVDNQTAGGDTSSEDEARTLLGKITTIEGEIDASRTRFKANKVGTIELNRSEVGQLVGRGESYIGQLARVFGVEVKGSALRPDMAFSQGPYGSGGGGSPQRQG